MPAWFRELCPSATQLALLHTDLPAGMASRLAPVPHRRLETLIWDPRSSLVTSTDPIRRHLQQQLAALPSITSLATTDLTWATRPALISSSLTRLELSRGPDEHPPPLFTHLPTQFPGLRDVDGHIHLILRDADLRALLRVPHLQTLTACALDLSDSHRGGPWPQQLHLHLQVACVDALALLPLDRIPKCTIVQGLINPTLDAAGAKRVANALRRWGAFNAQQDGSALLRFLAMDSAAVLASLPAFLAAAPQQPTTLDIITANGLKLGSLRQLAALLTPNVHTLRFTDDTFAPEVWPMFLPSLPLSVTALELQAHALLPHTDPLPTADQLRSLCLAAVRPVKVRVVSRGDRATALVQRVLATMGRAQQARLVSLEAADT